MTTTKMKVRLILNLTFTSNYDLLPKVMKTTASAMRIGVKLISLSRIDSFLAVLSMFNSEDLFIIVHCDQKYRIDNKAEVVIIVGFQLRQTHFLHCDVYWKV